MCSALIALLRGQRIGYELDEEANWGLNMEALKKSVDEVGSCISDRDVWVGVVGDAGEGKRGRGKMEEESVVRGKG